MSNAWVVRPKPHGYHRVEEFLDQNIVAIGWPHIGDLSDIDSREEIKERETEVRTYESNYKLGQAAGQIYRFVKEMSEGEYVVVPDGPYVYIGEIDGPYQYEESLDNSEEGYPHQRAVDWYHNKLSIKRKHLTGRVFDSLKSQLTLFNINEDDIDDIVNNKPYLFIEDPNRNLQKQYLEKLQSGRLSHINSIDFEYAVATLLNQYYSGLRKISNANSDEGDTDLRADMPGGFTLRVQVKHFYSDRDKLQPDVVDQLANSMETEDYGIIVTSGVISDDAINYSKQLEDRDIGFIDGEEFVEMLFESIDELEEEELAKFGLKHELGYL